MCIFTETQRIFKEEYMHVLACICDTYAMVCANDMHSLVRCVQQWGLLWINADPEDLWSQLKNHIT